MDTNFTFDESHTKPRIPNQALLDALRTFAQQPGKLPLKNFNKWPDRPCNVYTICLRFNGWRRALWAAGIPTARRGPYSPAELIDLLEQTWRKVGRAPGHATLRRVARIDGRAYTRHWGSLARARSLLARYHRNQISRAELLAPVPPSARKRHNISVRLRHHVLTRDHHRCQLCGRSPTTDPYLRLEIDHIHPISKGGQDTPENLRTLCQDCNRGKAAA